MRARLGIIVTAIGASLTTTQTGNGSVAPISSQPAYVRPVSTRAGSPHLRRWTRAGECDYVYRVTRSRCMGAQACSLDFDTDCEIILYTKTD